VENPDWLKLDNAANIYPATSSPKSPTQFRLSVTLTVPVKFDSLQTAWDRMLKRCPYFQVYLRRGFFWYYLQRHQDIPPIELLDVIPATFQIKNKKTHLIRIGARGRTIAIDFSHIITDGNGGMRFFLGLLSEYFRLEGMAVSKLAGVPQPEEQPAENEFEDAHRNFFSGNLPKPTKLSAAYHLSGSPVRTAQFKSITGIVPVDEMLSITRQYKVSITEFLTAVYLLVLLKIYQQESLAAHSVIRLQVPVNMRKYQSSATMRNFSLFVSPEIDAKFGEYSFEEILKRVHHTMQIQINRKELGRQVSRNVGGEMNMFVRSVPLLFKDIYLAGLYRSLGEKCYSGVLSNLGPIMVPQEIEAKIDFFSACLLPNFQLKKSCAMLSFSENMIIRFNSVIESTEAEKLFFTKLVEMGIHVRVKEEQNADL